MHLLVYMILPIFILENDNQVLFLQLRQLEKLAREVFVGRDWEVEDLLRELMEAVVFWLSNNKKFCTVTGESSVAEQSSGFEQVYKILLYVEDDCIRH